MPQFESAPTSNSEQPDEETEGDIEMENNESNFEVRKEEATSSDQRKTIENKESNVERSKKVQKLKEELGMDEEAREMAESRVEEIEDQIMKLQTKLLQREGEAKYYLAKGDLGQWSEIAKKQVTDNVKEKKLQAELVQAQSDAGEYDEPAEGPLVRAKKAVEKAKDQLDEIKQLVESGDVKRAQNAHKRLSASHHLDSFADDERLDSRDQNPRPNDIVRDLSAKIESFREYHNERYSEEYSTKSFGESFEEAYPRAWTEMRGVAEAAVANEDEYVMSALQDLQKMGLPEDISEKLG